MREEEVKDAGNDAEDSWLGIKGEIEKHLGVLV